MKYDKMGYNDDQMNLVEDQNSLPNEMVPGPSENLDECEPPCVGLSMLPPGTPTLVAACGVTKHSLPLHSVGTPLLPNDTAPKSFENLDEFLDAPPQLNESLLDAGLGLLVGAAPTLAPPSSTHPVSATTLSVSSQYMVYDHQMAEETESTKDGTTRLASDTRDTNHTGVPESEAEPEGVFNTRPSLVIGAAPTLPTPPSVRPVATAAHSLSSQLMVDGHQMAEETELTKDGTTRLDSDTRDSDTGVPETETEPEGVFNARPSLMIGAAPTLPTPPSTRPVTTAAHSISSQLVVDGQQMSEETESTKDATMRLDSDTRDSDMGVPETETEPEGVFNARPSLVIGAAPTLPNPPSMRPVTTAAHSISSQLVVDGQQMSEGTESMKDRTARLDLDTRDTGVPESEAEPEGVFNACPSLVIGAAPTLSTPPSTRPVATVAHPISSQLVVDGQQMSEEHELTKDGATQLALATQDTIGPDMSDTGCGAPGLFIGTVATLTPLPPTCPATMMTPSHMVDPRATAGPVVESQQEDISDAHSGLLEREASALPPLLSTSSATKASLVSSDWPNHMLDVHQYLTEATVMMTDGAITKPRNWGDRWLSCLESFFEFQRQAGFPESGQSFPPFTNVRPLEIAVWMKNGRHWQDADIIDVDTFGRRWWAWWNLLQPKSRIGDEDSPQLPTSEMDWSGLRKPGKNGFLLIIISLVWWGKGSNQDEQWIKAVTDVTAVLSCLNSISGPVVADKPKAKMSSAANAAGPIRPKRSRRGEVVVGEPSKKIRQR